MSAACLMYSKNNKLLYQTTAVTYLLHSYCDFADDIFLIMKYSFCQTEVQTYKVTSEELKTRQLKVFL